MTQPIDFKTAVIRAWDEVVPCPDGYRAEFCPSCFIEALKRILDGVTND